MLRGCVTEIRGSNSHTRKYIHHSGNYHLMECEMTQHYQVDARLLLV